MKHQFMLSLVFIFSCFASLQAQEVIAERQAPAEAIHQQRVGEAVDYQKTLRRFETAIKENDSSSINDLQKDLVSRMQERIERLETESSTDEKHITELKEQKEILEATEKFDFTKMSTDKITTLDHLRKLQRFAHLMADNYDIK